MSSPAVSIIVPCYNSGRFIRATLEAVRAQTFTDWECIVIDDASSDDSAAIVAAMAEEDPRIVPLRLPENLGAAGARNAGLERVRETTLRFSIRTITGFPKSLRVRSPTPGRPMRRWCIPRIVLWMSQDNFSPGGVKASDCVDLRSYMRNTEIGMSTSLIDREKIGAIHFKNIRLCQDTDLWLTLLDRGFIPRGGWRSLCPLPHPRRSDQRVQDRHGKAGPAALSGIEPSRLSGADFLFLLLRRERYPETAQNADLIMKVVVTGAGGFAGRHIVAALGRAGHEVVSTGTP